MERSIGGNETHWGFTDGMGRSDHPTQILVPNEVPPFPPFAFDIDPCRSAQLAYQSGEQPVVRFELFLKEPATALRIRFRLFRRYGCGVTVHNVAALQGQEMLICEEPLQGTLVSGGTEGPKPLHTDDPSPLFSFI
ncbi:MAG: hypothetical protein IPJ76_18910 [Flavobacteriales bacterium]|nr:MAG: hypothetical protein IPJ76_18910 [Flavobacteriales bacterium]